MSKVTWEKIIQSLRSIFITNPIWTSNFKMLQNSLFYMIKDFKHTCSVSYLWWQFLEVESHIYWDEGARGSTVFPRVNKVKFALYQNCINSSVKKSSSLSHLFIISNEFFATFWGKLGLGNQTFSRIFNKNVALYVNIIQECCERYH